MLTVDDLREHVTSSLSDDALQLHLDAAYAAIDAVFGSGADVSEYIYAGPGPLFMLSRPATTVGSLTENGVELDDTDFTVRGRQLVRLDTGPNGARRWRGWVDVTYTPEISEELRDEAAIALVEHTLNYEPGSTTERIGDWTQTQGGAASFQDERQAILDAFASARGLVLI